MTAQTSGTNPHNPVGYIDETSLESGHYGKPLILDRIFLLLVDMIAVLQKTAAVQAQRLNFLSKWQKAYTDQMNQIHAFTSENGDGHRDVNSGGPFPGNNQIETGHGFRFLPDGLDSDNDAASTARQDLNTANTTYTQQMQGNNNIISNDAKALQTNVNQTNDAVQAQTDMATSILQQMSTILTAIYSGA